MLVQLRLSLFFFFFKQKTAYEMRISDWSSDVCSSDLYHSPNVPDREMFRRDDRDRLRLEGALDDLVAVVIGRPAQGLVRRVPALLIHLRSPFGHAPRRYAIGPGRRRRGRCHPRIQLLGPGPDPFD